MHDFNLIYFVRSSFHVKVRMGFRRMIHTLQHTYIYTAKECTFSTVLRITTIGCMSEDLRGAHYLRNHAQTIAALSHLFHSL